MSEYVEISVDFLRDIILGKMQYRKCPNCLGKGTIMYNGDNGEEWPNQSQDAGEVEEILGDCFCEAGCDNCENCLGYILIPD